MTKKPKIKLGYSNEAEITIKAVCEMFGITRDHLKSKSRKEEIVAARRIFCMIVKKSTILSTTKIGRYINRDHSTVIFAIKTGEIYEKHWKPFAEAVGRCRERVDELKCCNFEKTNK